MTAAVITTWTLIDYAKQLLHDAGGGFFDDSDVDYERRLLEKVISKTQDYEFEYIAANYYRYNGLIYLLSPTMTGEDDKAYTLNATGSVVVTTGTDTRTDGITVTGAPVDFPEFMVDLCMFISGQRSMEADVALGPAIHGPGQIAEKMRNLAEIWRGVRTA